MSKSKSLPTKTEGSIKIAVFITSSVLLIVLLFFYYKEILKITSFPATSWTKDISADCAVVLTGGPYRVQDGFDLLNQKRVIKLIISGVNPDSQLRAIFPLLPFYGSVKEEDVILEKHSKTTFGNAQQSLQLVEALSCRDVLLITSRLHMYRSLRTFKSVFPQEIVIHPRAIVAVNYSPNSLDVFIEATKSIFYSAWAY